MSIFGFDSSPSGLADAAVSSVVPAVLLDPAKEMMHRDLLDKPENKGWLASASNWLGGFMNGIKKWASQFVSPNSYNADQVIEKKIDADESGIFSKVATACGDPSLAKKLKDICKDSVGDYVGLFMPSDPSACISLLRDKDGNSMHDKLATCIAQSLLDKNQGLAPTPAALMALRQKLSVAADEYAYAIDGFDPSISDTTKVTDEVAADNYRRMPPKFGVTAMINVATVDAMGKPDAKGVDRDSQGREVTGTLMPWLVGDKSSFPPDPAQHPNITLAMDDSQGSMFAQAGTDLTNAITTPLTPLTGPSGPVNPTPPTPAPPTVTQPNALLHPSVTGGDTADPSSVHPGIPPNYNSASAGPTPNRSAPTAGV